MSPKQAIDLCAAEGEYPTPKAMDRRPLYVDSHTSLPKMTLPMDYLNITFFFYKPHGKYLKVFKDYVNNKAIRRSIDICPAPFPDEVVGLQVRRDTSHISTTTNTNSTNQLNAIPPLLPLSPYLKL